MPIENPALVAHLESVLASANRPELVKSVLPTLIQCIGVIAGQLRSAQQVAAVGSANAFGDEQLNVDVLAERVIREAIRECPSIVTASSEEDPVERPAREGGSGTGTGADVVAGAGTATSGETYIVAFDPLDGSSIIAPNWTVGTIAGVWDGASALGGAPATKQVAAILGVYGPRTTAIVALRVPGTEPACFELGLAPDASGTQSATTQVVRPAVRLLEAPFKTRYFAPANLRAAAEDPRYMALITHYITERYTLRYIAGLVPDIVHMLTKGHGVYVNPTTATSKAKLRRLYELAPIALVMECVGATAIDPATGEDILARPIQHCDERSGLICGVKEEVDLAKRMLEISG